MALPSLALSTGLVPTGSLPLETAGPIIVTLYVAALLAAAMSDFLRLQIPNWLTAGLALAFPAAALLAPHPIDWLSHLAAGLAVFAGATVLFACRALGGGDVKLLAAVALWCGLPLVLPLLFLVALAGGVLALALVGLRQPLVQAVFLSLLRRAPACLYARMPIPYGIPIALAGIALAPRLPVFGYPLLG